MAKDGEAGADAALVGNILEMWVDVVDIVAHLVGEGDDVELAVVELTRGDRAVVATVEIEFVGEEGDFFGLHNELIGGTEVFVQFANGKFNCFEIPVGE